MEYLFMDNFIKRPLRSFMKWLSSMNKITLRYKCNLLFSKFLEDYDGASHLLKQILRKK